MRISFYIILITFSFMNILSAEENNYYLILKNNKVNVRYGPGFDYPIKFIYKKKNLPIRVIDKKENFRRIIDFKKNSGWIHISQLKKSNSLVILENKVLLYPEFMDFDQARNFFCASDCVAQTYRSASQSGVTPVAYHYGLPILVSNLNGLIKPIKNDDSGIITEINSTSIAKGLNEILQPKSLIKFRKNIQSSRSNYSWKKFNQQMIHFIE